MVQQPSPFASPRLLARAAASRTHDALQVAKVVVVMAAMGAATVGAPVVAEAAPMVEAAASDDGEEEGARLGEAGSMSKTP